MGCEKDLGRFNNLNLCEYFFEATHVRNRKTELRDCAHGSDFLLTCQDIHAFFGSFSYLQKVKRVAKLKPVSY